MADSQEAQRAARYALLILTFINLFNYLDRWVLSAVVESLRRDMGLSDTQQGVIATGFIIVYMLTSPIFGSLGDHRKRPPLIALGVAIWSVATSLAGFAQGFVSLFVTRSLVGVGEAAYGTIAPALLSDYFPVERRGRIFAFFFAAIPIGSAAGYIVGGLVDQHFGWRAAFWIAGAPGLLLAILVLAVKDVPRGLHDAPEIRAAAKERSTLAAYGDLLHNRPYVLTVLGYGAYTFALAGLAFWMPAFLERVRGMKHDEATVTFGIIAVCTGFAGTFTGGWLGDLFLKRTKQSYLWVSGIATLIAAPFTFLCLTSPSRSVFIPAIVVAELFIFMSTGPVNSAIVNVVSPMERATAVALSIFAMHLLGDVPVETLVGHLSDRFHSLEKAMLVLPVAVIVAGLIWCYAAYSSREPVNGPEA